MIDCAIIGDSIAAAVSHLRPGCHADARVSRNSSQQAPLGVEARVVVISLGSNDTAAIPTLSNLRRLRESMRASHVIWLVPTKQRAAVSVRLVADMFGDRMIEVRDVVGPDGVHPTPAGYRFLARETAQ